MSFNIAGDPHADAALEHPFGLLVGMALDQQFPMERAFAGPAKILERFGSLDPAAIAAADPEEFSAMAATTPAIHRFPASMASKIQAIAQVVVEDYDGDASRIWSDAPTGAALVRRMQALPAFGKQKAQIFTALLAKQCGVRPEGWEKAVGDYSLEGYRSVADVVDSVSLQKVRDYKQMKKAAAKNG